MVLVNIVLFGAGHNGVSYKKYLEAQCPDDKIVGFLDNRADKSLILNKHEVAIPVYDPSEGSNLSYMCLEEILQII